MKKINIAIDGYSSCGKSTLARDLAKELDLIYVDSGAMYRAVTLYAIQKGLFNEKGELDQERLLEELENIHIELRDHGEAGKADIYMNGERVEDKIRTMQVSEKVSNVAHIKAVREKLVKIQHSISREKGVVMDGRDIGTVVIPDADLKLFMTAEPEVRAERRFDELKAKGYYEVSLEEVRKNIEQRDYQDTHRDTDPLRQAADATVLDNTNLTPQQQFEQALSYAREKMIAGAN